MRRPLTLLLAVLALALVAAGCGSDDDNGSTAPATAAPTSTGTAGGAGGGGDAAGETVVVEMKNIQFEPKDVTVDVGQTIRWENLDTVDHDAVATSGADFKSNQFGQGGTFEWTAEAPGEIEYVCTLHPGMEGTITVR